jgi:peptide chain release factor
MWRCFLRPSRSICSSTISLKEQTTYLAKLASRKPPPTVLETDLEEKFIKGNFTTIVSDNVGSGPGGQKINKTSNCVQLRHIPTGMIIKCQETRSREENRRIARRILIRKLDVMENGEESLPEIKKWRAIRKKKSREKKSRRKYRRLEEEKRVADCEEEQRDKDD